MAPPRRRVKFQGSPAAHIRHLEKLVTDLQNENKALKAELAQLRRPQAFSSTTDRSSNFEIFIETPASQEKRVEFAVKSQRCRGVPTSESQGNSGKESQDSSGKKSQGNSGKESQGNSGKESQDSSGNTWEEMSDFLERLPASRERWVELSNAELSEPAVVLNIFKLFVLQTTLNVIPYTEHPYTKETASSLETVNAFGKLKAYLQNQAKLSKQIDTYSDILVHCMGLVARHDGISVEDVDKLIQTVAGKEQSSVYWARLRNCGGLAARMIEQLENKLGYLGSHLLLVCCPAIYKFRTGTDEKVKDLVTEVYKKTNFLCKLEGIVPVSFSPAFIITHLGKWSRDTVNAALGTKLSQDDYNLRVEHLRKAESLNSASPSPHHGPPLGHDKVGDRVKRRKRQNTWSGGIEQQQFRSYTEPPPDANIEETSSPSQHSLPRGRGPETHTAIDPTFIQQASSMDHCALCTSNHGRCIHALISAMSGQDQLPGINDLLGSGDPSPQEPGTPYPLAYDQEPNFQNSAPTGPLNTVDSGSGAQSPHATPIRVVSPVRSLLSPPSNVMRRSAWEYDSQFEMEWATLEHITGCLSPMAEIEISSYNADG